LIVEEAWTMKTSNQERVAKADVSIDAAVEKVWDGLTNPAVIKRYMAGADVVSEWRRGSPITWKGEWKGKPFEDKGVILEIDPRRRLKYSHFSPASGAPDRPENYHTVTVELTKEDGHVRVALSQDNNETDEARRHSEENWKMMLAGLKKAVEE
jgi:uncharacterized protein YndB with AHSA1/START domain